VPVEDCVPSVNPTAGVSASAADPIRAMTARLADQPDLTLPEVFRRVCEAAADALRVERTGVWLFAGETKALRCVSLFERSRRRHSKGACLHLAEFPGFLRAVTAAPLVACSSARTDPRTADLVEVYLAPHGITSALYVPLARDGRVVGVMAHEHVGPPREWPDDDRACGLAVADLLVGRMRAAEGALRTTPGAGIPFAAPRACGGAAHDLRNLLAEIAAHAEIAGRAPDLPAAVNERLARILDATGRAGALLRTLLQEAAVPECGSATQDTVRDGAPYRPSADETGEHHPLPPAGTGG
jgi:hypothetical protein